MLNLPTAIPKEKIEDFCQRHRVQKLALFGSILSADFGKDRDVDVLVEYLPDCRVTLFDMVEQESELSDLLGAQVDLRTPMELSRHFRKKVLQTAQVIYERIGYITIT
jgi:predicted nucleotidyltransferase